MDKEQKIFKLAGRDDAGILLVVVLLFWVMFWWGVYLAIKFPPVGDWLR